MLNYFNLLPFEILLLIKKYSYIQLNNYGLIINIGFSNACLLLDDYKSRKFLEFIDSETYKLYKTQQKDKGIRLNKLLSIEIIYQNLYKNFKDSKFEFQSNSGFYYNLSQHEYNEMSQLYFDTGIDLYILTELYQIFTEWIDSWSEIWLKNKYPKMYKKIFMLNQLINNPVYNLLRACYKIDQLKFLTEDTKNKLYTYINTASNNFDNSKDMLKYLLDFITIPVIFIYYKECIYLGYIDKLTDRNLRIFMYMPLIDNSNKFIRYNLYN